MAGAGGLEGAHDLAEADVAALDDEQHEMHMIGHHLRSGDGKAKAFRGKMSREALDGALHEEPQFGGLEMGSMRRALRSRGAATDAPEEREAAIGGDGHMIDAAVVVIAIALAVMAGGVYIIAPAHAVDVFGALLGHGGKDSAFTPPKQGN